MKNFADSPRSSRIPAPASEVGAVVLSLTLLIAAFAFWCFQRGYILYWGDAQAHLNISRSLIDSRQPGLDQIGTVWLPALHFLTLPFAQNDWLWQTGLAGAIPVSLCFVIAATALYVAARHIYEAPSSAVVVLCCFALNPNVLYLSSIPMTETVFVAGLAVAFLAILNYQETQKRRFLWIALCASWFMSFTRYDGWFLIPFIGALLARAHSRHRVRTFILFCSAASIPALLWMANSWWQTGNALDFLNGPYSAVAIQAGKPYPGWHNWRQAAQYYFTAGKLCTGSTLFWLGALGALVALARKRLRPVFFLFLTPAFYVWSMHSSANPIHVPTLWPFSYYNTRYGIAVTVFAAFVMGALADLFPARYKQASFALVALAVLPWLVHASPQNWICWKESEHNSSSRRVWTAEAARYMSAHYRLGDGLLSGFGDLTGIFCKLGYPLREITHEGTRPDWLMETTAMSAVHPMKWAIAQKGDSLYRAIQNSNPPAYTLVLEIITKDSPPLEIYHRTHD